MILSVTVTALLLTIGVRIPIALAIGASMLVVVGEVDALLFPQLFLSNIDDFTLLAVPFYLLAGAVMTRAGLGERLFAFINRLMPGIPGGLGYTTLGSTLFFAGMTGSSAADVAAVGSTALPAAERLGYRKEFIAGILAAGGTLGILVPPSLTMILYGLITRTSIVDLFIAGIVPAVILASLMGVVIAVTAPKRAYSVSPVRDAAQVSFLKTFRRAILALAAPAIIAGGIYTGFVTPTEAGALAVVWAALAGVAQRTLSPRGFWHACVDTARVSAFIFLVVAAATTIGQVLTLAGVPEKLSDVLITHFGGSQILFLLAVNLGFIILGMVLESFAMMLMFIPLLYPVASDLGIDLVHFGVIVTVNIEIALLTPPYGTNLFTVSAISGLSVGAVTRAVLPFLGIMVLGLLILTYWSWPSLVLVR